MEVVVVKKPSVPAVLEPSALHEAPSHLATWSACAMPSMLTASEPT